MREVLSGHPAVVEYAGEVMRRARVAPRERRSVIQLRAGLESAGVAPGRN